MTTNGIKTLFWGPNAWNFLFSAIAGSYPIKYDPNDKSHQKRAKGFTQLFNSLKEVLPCIYCRVSYEQFVKELPMKDYIHGRTSMMHWLYLLHDKVNQKLINQEQECYVLESKTLKNQLSNKTITPAKYKQLLAVAKTIKITKPSPPFQTILDKFELQRAGCSKKSKRCA
jgi:hypothetical protein